MASDMPILSIVTFLPMVGALLILLLVRGTPQDVENNARWSALWTSLITFAISILIWTGFDNSTHAFQFVEKADGCRNTANYHMGVDGISVFFILLSTLLTPIGLRNAVEGKDMIAFLVLETMMAGMFCALDFVAFYIFFRWS